MRPLVAGFCFVLSLTALAIAQDTLAKRPAKEILREFDSVRMPSMSDGADPESVRRFKKEIHDGCSKMAALALELHQSHPDHARVAALLDNRWSGLTHACDRADEVAKETAALLQQEGLRDDVKKQALLARARAMIASENFTDVERIDAVRATMVIKDEDDRLASSMIDLVERHIADPETQKMLFEIVVETWPDAKYGTRDAKALLRLHEAIGKPFAELLPEANRAWFAEQTKAASEFTVAQLWMGWLDRDGEDDDLKALKATRKKFGERVRLVGFLHGALEARMADAKRAGVDWPQAQIDSAEPMRNPFGAPKCELYFVLDRDLKIAGIVGRAALAGELLDQILVPSK